MTPQPIAVVIEDIDAKYKHAFPEPGVTVTIDTTAGSPNGAPADAFTEKLRAEWPRLHAALSAGVESAAALKEWVDYFDALDRDTEPGDRVAEVRNMVHGERITRSRAALADHERHTRGGGGD